MKKIELTLIAILLASFVYAQNTYYWSGGEKHYLKKQTNVFVVKFNKEQSIENIAEELKDNKNINRIIKIKQDIGIITVNDTTLNAKKLNENEDLFNAMPAFQAGEYPIYPTGEILMQPQKGTSVDDIIKLANNRVHVKSKTKYNTYVLETDGWEELFELSNLIYESGLVEYCHPNFIAPREKHQINDPKYSEQYYLNNTGQFGGTAGIDINAPEAWRITTGNCPVTVAVIDDGVESHEDLNGRVLSGYTPQTSQQNPNTNGAPNANDPTETAYPKDPDSPFGHGECCAGIIAASHNSLGICGIAPNVDIVPINIFNDWFVDQISYYGQWVDYINYTEDVQDCANAIDYAWDDAGADVISNSWGFSYQGAYFDAIEFAIERARTRGRVQGTDTLGCVVVFASGNSNLNFSGVTFPANIDGVITVGAINKSGNIWNYSSRGSEMDLVVPSGDVNLNGDVRTTDRESGDGYGTGNYIDNFGGTSAACPQVSGVTALILSARPDFTESQVRSVLQQTATDMGTSGFDNTYGYGRVNAYAAVRAVYPYISGPSNLCTSGSTYSVVNAPSGSYVSWSFSSNIQSYYGGNTWIALRAIGNGEGWVEAYIPLSCGDTIHLPRMTVWAGIPTAYSFYTEVNGQEVDYYDVALICPNITNCFDAWPNVEEMGTTNFNWHLPSWYSPSGGFGANGLCFNANGTVGSSITADVTNSCGTGYGVIQLYLGDNGCSRSYQYAISPNPTSTVLTVEQLTAEEAVGRSVLEPAEVYDLSDTKDADDGSYTVEIWHE
ncbi:MAG TPA: S8 family serine peptidase, partial [Prolixibacteraceae bacterium]|nr:S8 family serine peptidase [Prolixibacteraceae bacterium]